MDTPLAISAIDEETMIQKGALNMQTLYQSIPGLGLPDQQ